MQPARPFSRNSLINVARKAGVTSMSKEAVEKLREILDEKVDECASKLALFYNSKNSKTVTRKMVNQFLESENILFASDQDM